MRKTKNYLKQTHDNEKLHPDFSEEGKKEKPAGHVGVFCQNLGINFTSNFSFNNGSILEIHDYFRTTGNASFHDLSKLIKTL